MTELSCDNCGSQVFIAEYYNTEMDSDTILDVMPSAWVYVNHDVVERVDCLRCDNSRILHGSEE